MAGVDVGGGGKGGRKQLDSEINMIPMIDLLMVTISFLLITAVWTHMSRIEADAQVPSSSSEPPPCAAGGCPPEPKLHVEMRDPAKFVLFWQDGANEIGRTEVPRAARTERVGSSKIVRYPALADAIGQQWREHGVHKSPTDATLDKAVLHTDDATPYGEIVAAMDAVHQVSRPVRAGTREHDESALAVTFSVK